jgi:hypothetical protein
MGQKTEVYGNLLTKKLYFVKISRFFFGKAFGEIEKFSGKIEI